jgi:putative FmdB family regulatory protein
MPIYEYQCQACEKTIEALQKISDAPLLKCPKCGADALRKKVSAPTFRLKGSGWYETDFKTGSKKNLAGGGGASAGDAPSTSGESKAGDSKSSESKPADSKPADSKSSESKKSA